MTAAGVFLFAGGVFTATEPDSHSVRHTCGAPVTLVYPLPMKQYLIDELRLEDYKKFKTYLDENIKQSPVEGLYWIPLAPEHLAASQAGHSACGPHYLALELQEDRIACELLVRAEQVIRCSCIGYATQAQRNWLIDYIDAILEKLDISV